MGVGREKTLLTSARIHAFSLAGPLRSGPPFPVDPALGGWAGRRLAPPGAWPGNVYLESPSTTSRRLARHRNETCVLLKECDGVPKHR